MQIDKRVQTPKNPKKFNFETNEFVDENDSEASLDVFSNSEDESSALQESLITE